MYTFLIISACIVTGFLGLSSAAQAQVKAPHVTDESSTKVSADQYYLQSWNCLTNF